MAPSSSSDPEHFPIGLRNPNGAWAPVLPGLTPGSEAAHDLRTASVRTGVPAARGRGPPSPRSRRNAEENPPARERRSGLEGGAWPGTQVAARRRKQPPPQLWGWGLPAGMGPELVLVSFTTRLAHVCPAPPGPAQLLRPPPPPQPTQEGRNLCQRL